MPDYKAHITYDKHGCPGIWARDVDEAYFGMGYVHGLHRPLQALVLMTAGQGALSQAVWPTPMLTRLDTLVHRCNFGGRAQAALPHLAPRDRQRLMAFVDGMTQGFARRGPDRLLRALGVRFVAPDMQAVLSGLLLSSYLGLAESQDRMERAIVACVQHGADVAFLQQLHAPHLVGWDPALLRRIKAPLEDVVALAHTHSGGSNAWAVSGARTRSGAPMLCGDPHLPVNQLPAILLPIRVRLPDQYWLGASIPGLPGLAIGRNKDLAFSGTFSCADNIDSVIASAHDDAKTHTRTVYHARRFCKAKRLDFAHTTFGVLDDAHYKGLQLSTAWCSGQDVALAMGAYMQLPVSTSVAQAREVLQGAHTLSLHYVLADRKGVIGQQQAGIVPRRQAGWSGLYPLAPRSMDGATPWRDFVRGAKMPATQAVDDMVVSANEAGVAQDGTLLATLAQPGYRRARIRALLLQSRAHDAQSMGRIQQDVYSLQAARLAPYFIAALQLGPVRQALQTWDLCYDAQSLGAHAFSLCYDAVVQSLAPQLGGAAWRTLVQTTETKVWWCRALDDFLGAAQTWHLDAPWAQQLRGALKQVGSTPCEPWGRVQRVAMPHMLYGLLPYVSRGSRPLVGSIATVSQGNLVPAGAGTVAVAPAFRMVCDLGDDALYCAMPGGIDDSPWHHSYAQWLEPYAAGAYHRLVAPSAEESACML